jgi:hypothetical protein
MKHLLLLCLLITASAHAQRAIQKNPNTGALIEGFSSGANTIKLSATGTLEWTSGAALTNASDFRTSAGLVIGTNVQAYHATLAALASLSNSAGVLTNNGSGTLTYTGTINNASAGTGANAKIPVYASGGVLNAGQFSANSAGPANPSVVMAPTSVSYNQAVYFADMVAASLTGNRTWTLPDVTGTLITSGNLSAITATGTITSGTWQGTDIALDYLAQGGATDGQAMVWDNTAGTWEPGTIGGGLTIGTTSITGGTSGRLLISGATLGELTLGSGVSTALGNATDAASGLLTYGIIGTSGAKLPLLNAANSFSALQTVTGASNTQALQVSGTITGGSQTRSLLRVSDDWTGATGATSAPTLIEATISDTGASLNYGATTFMNFRRNGTSVLRIDHGGSLAMAGGMFMDSNSLKFQVPSSGYYSFNGDVLLYRDAAGVLAQRNSTAAQSFRVANTHTSTTNHEYFVID